MARAEVGGRHWDIEQKKMCCKWSSMFFFVVKKKSGNFFACRFFCMFFFWWKPRLLEKLPLSCMGLPHLISWQVIEKHRVQARGESYRSAGQSAGQSGEPGPPKTIWLEVSPRFWNESTRLTERKTAERQPCVSWNRNKYLAGSKWASRNPAGQSLDDSTQRFSSETRLETNQTLKSHGPNKMCVWNEHILDWNIYI